MDDPVYFAVRPDASYNRSNCDLGPTKTWISPDENLDPHSELYYNAKLEQQLGRYETELVMLSYIYVHPYYPITESEDDFIQRRKGGELRA